MRTNSAVHVIVISCLFLLSACSFGTTTGSEGNIDPVEDTTDDEYSYAFEIIGEANVDHSSEYVITITDSEGKPVEEGKATLILMMPYMGHEDEITLEKHDEIFSQNATFRMSGYWVGKVQYDDGEKIHKSPTYEFTVK
ncbi:hypothetical protein [Bacillus sp. JCM 19041]|uniref:hypothetical protein n=1 Tax=Bacillus sp. JCM 19041 TaxID=1460637 RepID=UPI0006CF4026